MLKRSLKMRKFRELTEAKDTIVFGFGRFNPPTTGHEKVIKKIASVAGSNPWQVFPSHTQNPKKDPLPQALKTAYMRKMFKRYARNIVVSKARNAIEIAVELYDQGYKNLIMVAGSDRVKAFDTMLNNYNGVEGKAHGYYKFDSIKIVSAGERDPDAEGVEGMSASKMRKAATDGDYDSFSMGVPTTLSDADKKKLYRDVRKYMGIREERDMGDMSDFEAVRDAYLTGKIWNVGSIVETEHGDGEIVRKGTNYLSYVAESGKVHKAWLHDIAERNYAKEYQNYHSRPEQIARRSSRNKARRVMGDKTKIGMDVGHKDNNPLNNDPKNLRNEDPSKNRREPRLRNKELDEFSSQVPWIDRAIATAARITHPRGWNKVVAAYVDGMKDKENQKHPSSWAADVSQRYRVAGLTPRSLIKYINTLVAKGQLPKELKAAYVSEQMSFSDFVTEIQQDSDIKDKEGTQPAKYHKGLSKSTKQKRDAHFKKKKSGPAPGDADAETKPSVHTKKYKQMFGEKLPADADQGDYIDDFQKSDAPQFKGKSKEKRKDMAIAAYLSRNEEVVLNEKIEGLVNKSEKSGISYSILKKVYDRGLAAYKTGHRPGTTAPQWAMARVNSFITKGKGTWGKADADLAKQVEMLEDTELNEWGEVEEKAEYQGKKVTLNKPFYTPDGPKKSAVYVTGPKGDPVIVRFGDKNMEIKVDDPERRKSFRARHNCDNPGPKWKARYWSCKAW